MPARLTRLQRAAVLLLLLLLVVVMILARSSSAAAAPTTERYHNHVSRKLLVAVPRTSPETAPAASSRGQQEMDVSVWRTAAPFRRPGASLGRRVPGSHANPSHN
ncbi:hypothetical protein GUJ93_ZPchr0006g42705 [Zizania palustris]|uniref:Uncharacterized protein n=1 Tax=Zizania palustris TaxID=103762 RepID=A0A8J5SEK5_ZIZPA|nr:hypothetical protein GUJ93_ZPchr0006g42705 [Zizania palustris]